MHITINNIAKDIAPGATLDEVIFAHLGEKQNGIAVAVNHQVIPRAERPGLQLQQGDDILIIKATQGG